MGLRAELTIDSPAAIVDTVLDTVTPKNADRVAIVLDRGSGYTPLVEAALDPATSFPGTVYRSSALLRGFAVGIHLRLLASTRVS